MKNIPQWILDFMKKEDFKCPHCGAKFDSEHIMSLGIRHSIREMEKEVLFTEYLCSNCKKQTDLEFTEMTLADLAQDVISDLEDEIADYIQDKMKNEDMSMEDLDFAEYDALMEEYYNYKESFSNNKNNKFDNKSNKNNKSNKRNKSNKSKITLKNIKEAKKKLNNIKSHEEFLLLLGMSQEEINKYNIKKR